MTKDAARRQATTITTQSPGWDKYDPLVSKVRHLEDTIRSATESAAAMIVGLPHMSIDSEEAKLLIDIYAESVYNRNYRGRGSITIEQLYPDLRTKEAGAHGGCNSIIMRLEHLNTIGVLIFGTNAEDTTVSLTEIGERVGFKLYERRKFAKGVVRKEIESFL